MHEEGFRLERRADGELELFDPQGWLIEAAPPMPDPGEDALAALISHLDEAGVVVNPLDTLPSWDGTPLDLGYAIDVLWRPREEVSPEDGSAETSGAPS